MFLAHNSLHWTWMRRKDFLFYLKTKQKKTNMFYKDGFYIPVIFLHLIQVYVIYCFAFGLTPKYPDLHKAHNPQFGKFYWLYKKEVNYDEAEKICLQNNQHIVQLPTEEEQIWVTENLIGNSNCFWTGLKMIGLKDWQWIITHGPIKNLEHRWNKIIPLRFEQTKAYACGKKLFGSNGSDPCSVVCQKEYSMIQDKFIQIFGKQFLGKQLRSIQASVFQCVSICMATANCALAVTKQQQQQQRCTIFDGHINNVSIDCSAEGTTCYK